MHGKLSFSPLSTVHVWKKKLLSQVGLPFLSFRPFLALSRGLFQERFPFGEAKAREQLWPQIVLLQRQMERKNLVEGNCLKKAIISIIKELRGTLGKVERKYFLSCLTDLTIEATSLFYKQLLGFLLFIERRFLRTSRSTQDLFFYISAAWKLGQQHWILWLYFIRKKSPFTPVVRDRNLEGISDCSGSSSKNFWGVVALQRTLHIHWVSNFYIIFLPFQVSDITAALFRTSDSGETTSLQHQAFL